jgi:hypothetical protein
MAEPDAPPPQDPLEVFRRLWGPLGLPVPGMAVPTMDPKQVEKRIADLKSVEAWLQMNLNMVRFAVQGLELQRAALQAMGGRGEAALSQMAAAGANSAAGTMLWPWALMQQAMTGSAPAEPAEPEKPKE